MYFTEGIELASRPEKSAPLSWIQLPVGIHWRTLFFGNIVILCWVCSVLPQAQPFGSAKFWAAAKTFRMSESWAWRELWSVRSATTISRPAPLGFLLVRSAPVLPHTFSAPSWVPQYFPLSLFCSVVYSPVAGRSGLTDWLTDVGGWRVRSSVAVEGQVDRSHWLRSQDRGLRAETDDEE